MFQTSTTYLWMLIQIVFNLANCWHGLAKICSKKFQTNGVGMLRLRVQEKNGTGNKTITPLLLYTWQATQKFIGNILAQSRFAQLAGRNGQYLWIAQWCPTILLETTDLKPNQGNIKALAKIMLQSLDLQPMCLSP